VQHAQHDALRCVLLLAERIALLLPPPLHLLLHALPGCTGDAQEMNRGCTGDEQEMHRRCTGDAQEMNRRSAQEMVRRGAAIVTELRRKERQTMVLR